MESVSCAASEGMGPSASSKTEVNHEHDPQEVRRRSPDGPHARHAHGLLPVRAEQGSSLLLRQGNLQRLWSQRPCRPEVTPRPGTRPPVRSGASMPSPRRLETCGDRFQGRGRDLRDSNCKF